MTWRQALGLGVQPHQKPTNPASTLTWDCQSRALCENKFPRYKLLWDVALFSLLWFRPGVSLKRLMCSELGLLEGDSIMGYCTHQQVHPLINSEVRVIKEVGTHWEEVVYLHLGDSAEGWLCICWPLPRPFHRATLPSCKSDDYRLNPLKTVSL